MIIKSYKEVEKFVRESNIDELKRSLKIMINNAELDTKEKLIFLLKDFIQTIENHTEKISATPKTLLEVVEQLQMFFQEDMWYAKGAEWKNEDDMLKYLNCHFNICKKAIRKILNLNKTGGQNE